ncbi:hypothetical protein [Bradyrhizobium sp. ORS 375]|uniref:hypothetical protein n=1 Tax=Bradyrhizobium sp. (strain ORS 375) TaxID=566679 RepID=UPI00031A1926|nr:hypothetical protein [Bradyrhizobium sp. ORS 375]
MKHCLRCDDARWVCENHPDRPWTDSLRGCQCGAGAPCPICNATDDDATPDLPDGFVVEAEAPFSMPTIADEIEQEEVEEALKRIMRQARRKH